MLRTPQATANQSSLSVDRGGTEDRPCWPADLHFAFRNLGEPGLTNAEARIAALLYRRAQASHEALLMATRNPGRGDDERSVDIVKVHISHIRRKFAPLGVRIETMRPGFYKFDRDAKARLRELLQDAQA